MGYGYDSASSAPMFANGAVTGAFGYLYANAASRWNVDQQMAAAALYNPQTALAWEPIPSGMADAATGFGDGAFKALTIGFGDLGSVRDSLGISGSIDYNSSAYEGFGFAGGVVGGSAVGGGGLRVLSRFTGTAREGVLHYINHNPYFRVGPGRMPANGGLPGGTSVPRVSVGPQRSGISNPHLDLRVRPFD